MSQNEQNELKNREQEKTQREKVVKIAKSWLKTPYHPEARVKGAGADCLTLLAGIYEEAGLVPRVAIPHYTRDWHMHRSEERYLNGIMDYMREVDLPLPGDLVLWRFGRCFSHGAIVVEWPVIIHAWVNIGCVLEDVSNAAWAQLDKNKLRIKKFFSYWD